MFRLIYFLPLSLIFYANLSWANSIIVEGSEYELVDMVVFSEKSCPKEGKGHINVKTGTNVLMHGQFDPGNYFNSTVLYFQQAKQSIQQLVLMNLS